MQLVSESSEGTEVINWDNHEDPALGRWRGTLKKIEHDAAASQNAYILQKDGTFKHITEQSNAWVGAFVSAFYPHELPECDSFSIKLGEVFPGGGPDEDITMDFPADFFVTDCDIDDPTGIVEMRNEENSSLFTLHSPPGTPWTAASSRANPHRRAYISIKEEKLSRNKVLFEEGI